VQRRPNVELVRLFEALVDHVLDVPPAPRDGASPNAATAGGRAAVRVRPHRSRNGFEPIVNHLTFRARPRDKNKYGMGKGGGKLCIFETILF
jgi:hypothetical protein